MSEVSRAYSRGYYRGSRGLWPDHRPLVPPHKIVGQLVKAAQSLRDAADHICATLSEDDDFVSELAPRIDDLDIAMTEYAEWLRNEHD